MASARLARPRALWLQLRNVPILRMLQLEEALFRTDRRSWFITNEWDSAQPAAEAVVLGISGRPEQMLHVEAAQRSGIPVIKRFTGGGTVVVDSDTLFASFICTDLFDGHSVLDADDRVLCEDSDHVTLQCRPTEL